MSFWHDQQKRPVSYFEILNVSPDDNDDIVKQAYRRLAFKFHPDHNPHNRNMAEHRFHMISEAYAQIKTQQQRARYKEKLELAHKKPANQNGKSLTGILSHIAVFFGLSTSSTAKSKTGKG